MLFKKFRLSKFKQELASFSTPQFPLQYSTDAYIFINQMHKKAKGDPAFTAAVIDKGFDMIPAIDALNSISVSRFVNMLADKTKGSPADTATVVRKGLDIACARAGKDRITDRMAAWELIDLLGETVKSDSVLTSVFIDRGIGMLPVISARCSRSASLLIDKMQETVGGDPAHTAAFIDKGLGIMPVLAEQGNYTASNLLGILAKMAKNDPVRTAAVIDKSLDIAPTLSRRCGFTALKLISTLVDTVRGDPASIAIIIDRGLPVVCATAAWGARDEHHLRTDKVVNRLLIAAKINTQDGFVCREFMQSAQGGRNERTTLVIFGDNPESSVAMTGCFNGNLPELRQAVNNKHPENSPHRAHYDRVIGTAFDALARREQIPSLRDFVLRGPKAEALTAS